MPQELLHLHYNPESIQRTSEWSSDQRMQSEVSKLPLEEVEVLEQPLEEVLGEVLGWKGHMVVLGIARRGLE